jgi:hypothetical protein
METSLAQLAISGGGESVQTSGQLALGHLAPGQNVEVKVENGLASPLTVIDHESEGIPDTEILGNATRHQQ